MAKRTPPKRKQRKPGRPSKFTPEVRAKIIEAINAGNYREVAAGYAGVSMSSLKLWMTQDEGFSAEVQQAERRAEIRMVAIIAAAAPKDAKHAQWWLERKFHERWGRKDRIESRQIDKDGNDAPAHGVFVIRGTLSPEEWLAQHGKNAGSSG